VEYTDEKALAMRAFFMAEFYLACSTRDIPTIEATMDLAARKKRSYLAVRPFEQTALYPLSCQHDRNKWQPAHNHECNDDNQWKILKCKHEKKLL